MIEIMYPKITIVTPNFNYGHFLEATIQSVLAQNYPNLEYIIIDGGSTDNSIEIIKKYERSVTYWCTGKDRGMYDAINKGFAMGTGEIMAWLNSDDVYFPWAFKTVSEVFTQFPDVNWVTSLQPGLMDYSGTVLDFHKFKGFSKLAFEEGMYGSGKNTYGAIQQESTFWRTSLWKETGSNLSLTYKMAGDYELWSRYFRRTPLYGLVSPLGCYRFQQDQQTNKGDIYQTECEAIHRNCSIGYARGNFMRKSAHLSKLPKLPFIGTRIARALGYSSTILTKVNANTPSTTWVKQTVKFL